MRSEEKRDIWSSDLRVRIESIRACRERLMEEALSFSLTDIRKEKMESFLRHVEEAEFQVAFVGTIKAGKSTLINALLGDDYASVRTSPETAVLTRFGDSGNDKYRIEVCFYTREEWDSIWKEAEDARQSGDPELRDRIAPFLEEYRGLNAESVKDSWIGHKAIVKEYDGKEELSRAIGEYTSSKSALHYFVKSVFVGIRDSGLPPRMILCDTPGLDDVLSYRSNVTKRYIKSANAVFVCVLCRFLGGEQYHTIQGVFSQIQEHPERIFVIGTQIDTLQNPLKDWQEQKEEWKKYLRGGTGFKEEALADSNIIGVSAEVARRLRREDARMEGSDNYDDLRYFSRKFGCLNRADLEETYEKLEAAAGVLALMETIQEKIFRIYASVLEKKIRQEYELIRDEMKLWIQEKRQENQQMLSLMDSRETEQMDAISEVNREIQNLEAEHKEFKDVYRRLEQESGNLVKKMRSCFSALC